MKIFLINTVFCLGFSFVTDAQYYGIVRHQDTRAKSFNEYPNTALTSVPQIREESTTDYQECIRICEYEEVTCESINVITDGKGSFECVFFTTADGTFEVRNDTVFISKKEPRCSGYCAELSYMDLCGKCKCRDKCNSLYSHYCDCTEAFKEKMNCRAFQQDGLLTPGLYNIKINSGTGFEGFCEIQSDGTAWLTIMRRMVINDEFHASKRSMDDYIKGFGDPHDPIYWLGLNKIVAFTQSRNTILRVVLRGSGGKEWFGEYEGFKVDGQYNYVFTSYHTDCCQIDNGFGVNRTHPFGMCSWNKNFWFDDCKIDKVVTGYPLERVRIRWGRTSRTFVTVSLLLRHGSLKTETTRKYTGYGWWSTWTSCTKSCGKGSQERTRTCDRAPTANQVGGIDCSPLGDVSLTATRFCNTRPCPIPGGYNHWYIQVGCSVVCAGGVATWHRHCDNPRPQHGGKDCSLLGPSTETRVCNTHPCPVHGNWGAWGPYGGCSKTCGTGYMYRYRYCNNPSPAHSGHGCPGDGVYLANCNTHSCPCSWFGCWGK